MKAVGDRPLALPRDACRKRRRQLMRIAGEDTILILRGAPERVRSRDTHYPYRQDSDFWYLAVQKTTPMRFLESYWTATLYRTKVKPMPAASHHLLR